MKRQQWILVAFLSVAILFLVYVGFQQPNVHREYLRFHVIANSDSPEDQALKLRVRDRLLEHFGAQFAGVDSLKESREKILQNLNEIEAIARKQVEEEGKAYPVKVELTYCDFPTKAYGDLVLPAGKYEALRVIIGSGQGANWWCVMFPPLCFVDISHGVAKGGSIHLSAEEEKESMQLQNLRFFRSSDERTVEYRLKFLEFLRQSRAAVAKALSFMDRRPNKTENHEIKIQ